MWIVESYITDYFKDLRKGLFPEYQQIFSATICHFITWPLPERLAMVLSPLIPNMIGSPLTEQIRRDMSATEWEHDFLMTFLWLSHTFSRLSHKFLMIFIWLSHNFLMTFLSLSYNFFFTFSCISHKFLMTFSLLY